MKTKTFESINLKSYEEIYNNFLGKIKFSNLFQRNQIKGIYDAVIYYEEKNFNSGNDGSIGALWDNEDVLSGNFKGERISLKKEEFGEQFTETYLANKKYYTGELKDIEVKIIENELATKENRQPKYRIYEGDKK